MGSCGGGAEIVPLTLEEQAYNEDYFRQIKRENEIFRNPFGEIERLRNRQEPLEEIVAMFRFYLDSRPGTILIQTDSGAGMDLREWIGKKFTEAEEKA